MALKASSTFVDYQRRSEMFSAGDMVSLVGTPDIAGRVTSVFPAIGMIDVEWPGGNTREPVETIQKHIEGDDFTPPGTNSVPGGAPVPVKRTAQHRVAEAFVKKALYWAAPDRHYKATKAECESGEYHCPKCKDTILKPASYQRAGGTSEKLLGCNTCLFLIKACDIIGHPNYEDDAAKAELNKRPFARIRLTGGA